MKKWTIGVDVGGTEIKFGLFEDRLKEKWSIPTNVSEEGSHILREIAETIVARCRISGVDISNLAGVGMGLPGPVLDGNVVRECVNLGWSDVAAARELSQLLAEAFSCRPEDIPVRAANDANVAALGEMWLGGGKTCKSLIMVTLGTGVGGGVVINGQIYNGVSGCAGEIGHIICVDEKDITGNCRCGNRGCLEQIASATGIVKYAGHYLAKTDIPSVLRELLQKKGNISTKDVFDAGKNGDEAAEQIIDTVTNYLGRALAGISAVINPECILIGGGVSAAGEYLREKVACHFREQAFSELKNTPVRLAVLGNEAGIFGAAYMMISERIREDSIL